MTLNTLRPLELYEIALDIQLNAAILAISRRILLAAFDVSAAAPQTYEELVAHLDGGKRFIVFSEGAGQTIYGDPEVNYSFRAWHDWCHWRGRHDFSLEGERATYAMQAQQLIARYGDNPQTRRWRVILYAEIIGQREFFDAHGHFPEHQREFVEAYLAEDGCPKECIQ